MEEKTFAAFFNNLSSKLAETKRVDLITSAFKECQTDADRVAFVLHQKVITDLLRSRTCHQGPKAKSESQSENFRAEGNNFFRRKDFKKALQCYTKSVFNAPCTGKDTVNLSFALANRSAVLFHLKDFKSCLQDSEKAISMGYPEKLKYKLLDRMGRSHLKIGCKKAAKEAFQMALKALKDIELSASKKNEIQSEISRLQRLTENDESCENTSVDKVDVDSLTHEIISHGINPVYPCAKASFDIKYNSAVGRCAIATRDIEPGELILVEKPFTSVLLPDRNLTHCHHCLCRCSNLIGCKQCSSVGFCSQQCKDRAWQDYHSIECSYLDHLQESHIDFGHLSLRMVIKAGLGELMCFSDDNKCNGDTKDGNAKCLGINSNGIYNSLDYGSVCSLIGHSTDRSLSDLFRRAVTAVFLLKFIEHEPFFSEDLVKYTLDEKKVCIGSHILKQLQMLPCNAHEVSELRIDKSNIASSELKEIGSAIYATLSLLNHSCDPSVVRHSYKDSCALRAIKYIPKGGEIIDNYGALYAVTEYKERQNKISPQYYFTCACDACKNNWPLYSDLADVPPDFKCPKCAESISISTSSTTTQCSFCKFEIPINTDLFDSSKQRYLIAMESVLHGGDPVVNLPPLLSHMQLMSKYVRLPWIEFNNCQEIVKQCYSMLANHYYIN